MSTIAAWPRRGDRFVIAALIFGLFLPTSLGGAILVPLQLTQFAVLIFLLTFAAPPRASAESVLRFWISLMIPTIVLAATFVSLSPRLAMGGLIPYLGVAALFASDLTPLRPGPRAIQALALVNVMLLVLGVLVVAGQSPGPEILTSWYATAYEDLLPNMLSRRKPVGTFGSHSTAGLCYYLLMHLWLSTYEARGKARDLLLAVGNLALAAALGSATSWVFTAVGVGRLVWVAARSPRAAMVLGPLVALAAAALAVFPYLPELELLARAAFWSDLNGLLGRYGSSGSLLGTIGYITEHPFRPLGVGHRLDVFYGDSGPVEYMLRGSVPLLLCMYAGFWLFLRANVQAARQRWHLFLPIMAFELGFTSLTYPRLLYLLPLAVVYLNGLEPAPHPAAAAQPAGLGANVSGRERPIDAF